MSNYNEVMRDLNKMEKWLRDLNLEHNLRKEYKRISKRLPYHMQSQFIFDGEKTIKKLLNRGN